MAGTGVNDRGFAPAKDTYFLTADLDVSLGDVKRIDVTSLDANTGLPDAVRAATVGDGSDIYCVAIENIAAGDRGWWATKGAILVKTAAVAVETSLVIDATVDQLDDTPAAGDKIIGKALAANTSAGTTILVLFNGEEGFGIGD